MQLKGDKKDVGSKNSKIAKERKRKDEADAKAASKGEKKGLFNKFGKVMADDEKNCKLPTIMGRGIAKSVNFTYNISMAICTGSKKLMWIGSCVAFMWVFPITFELFQEQ